MFLGQWFFAFFLRTPESKKKNIIRRDLGLFPKDLAAKTLNSVCKIFLGGLKHAEIRFKVSFSLRSKIVPSNNLWSAAQKFVVCGP